MRDNRHSRVGILPENLELYRRLGSMRDLTLGEVVSLHRAILAAAGGADGIGART